ncbi:MAG: hypothetical protein QXX51_08330 [Candidatus Bathyarchaeia archaeon]
MIWYSTKLQYIPLGASFLVEVHEEKQPNSNEQTWTKKATTLYHQTKNILLVKEYLGHASLENTLLCIQVEQAIFGLTNDDEYNVTATNNKEEIKQLLAVGFEYVCQKDDILFFRKRK